jgi:hypothetical protein
MIDTCGSLFVRLEDMALSSVEAGLSNPSRVGILQATLTVKPECQFHTYRNVMIDLPDIPTANGGYGTVGIANCQAESVTYDSLFIRCNLPAILTVTSYFLGGIDSPYYPGGIDPLVRSMGSVKFVGHNNLWTVNRRSPAVLMSGVDDMSFSGEITSIGTSGTDNTAFQIQTACTNITINAVVEGRGTVFRLTGPLIAANVNIVSGNPIDPTAPVIYGIVDSGGAIYDSDMKFTLSGPAPSGTDLSLNRNLVAWSGEDDTYFRNTTIKTNQPKAHAIDTLSTALISNSTFRGLVIEAADGKLDTNVRVLSSLGAIADPAGLGAAGFSAMSTNICYYHVVGDEVTVRFNFVGTSNQTYFTFELPFAAHAALPIQPSFNVQLRDNGIWQLTPGVVSITAGSRTATIYRDLSATPFTSSNEKGARGEIRYYRAPTYPF